MILLFVSFPVLATTTEGEAATPRGDSDDEASGLKISSRTWIIIIGVVVGLLALYWLAGAFFF